VAIAVLKHLEGHEVTAMRMTRGLATLALTGLCYTDATFAGTSCPWDCSGDNDGTVGIVDFLALLGEWDQPDTPCDFDGGGVGIVDFLKLLANWGPCPAPTQCGSGTGTCCVPNGTPGCEDGACCDVVCALDPYCCDEDWDGLCADNALTLCSCPKDNCGPGHGSCCVANGTPGCEDEACCDSVCALDPYCCDEDWDGLCADNALTLCSCPKGPCGSGHGNCCGANGTPGCEDVTCCESVCAIDPFCCDVEWDGLCADQAQGLCDCP